MSSRCLPSGEDLTGLPSGAHELGDRRQLERTSLRGSRKPLFRESTCRGAEPAAKLRITEKPSDRSDCCLRVVRWDYDAAQAVLDEPTRGARVRDHDGHTAAEGFEERETDVRVVVE